MWTDLDAILALLAGTLGGIMAAVFVLARMEENLERDPGGPLLSVRSWWRSFRAEVLALWRGRP